MSLQVFNKEVDVAVIGLTNSGKSTFITSMIDRSKFGNTELLKKLCDNDGGLTKVTTFYALTECGSASVDKVEFYDDFVEENAKKTIEILRKLKIDVQDAADKEDEVKQIRSALNEFHKKLEGDLAYTIQTINKKDADKIIRYIKIKVPATQQAIQLMSKYGFDTVVLRDTRGFLDESMSSGKKSPNLADSGLDGIQACVFMNGRDSVMPNLARDMYGDFVKSIFESVPTFIIEQSGYLTGKLEDCADDNSLVKAYNDSMENPKVIKHNFTEIKKFLEHLGVVDRDGESTNQLIQANKRQLLLPEIVELKNKEKNYDSEDYKLYALCEMEVFKRLLESLADFRELLKRIVSFFDNAGNVASFQSKVLETFENLHFSDIVTDYLNGDRTNSVYVRPITNDFDMTNRLDNLIKKSLLGPRGGITAKTNGYYDYGHTGTFAVTAWKALNEIIVDFDLVDNYTDLAEVIVSSIGENERNNKNVVNTYILEVKQCLKYVLQNSCTDTRATFSGYYFVSRDKVVDSINKVKAQWKNYEPKHGVNAIDIVFLKKIKQIMTEEHLVNEVNLARVSQLYVAFRNVIEVFFSCVSKNHNYLGISNEVSV